MEKRRFMLTSVVIVLAILLLHASTLGDEMLNVVNTPTAYSLMRGFYYVNMNAYGGGGINTRIAIGLTDRLTLGLSEDVEGLVGQHHMRWYVPGVLARITFLSPDEYPIGFALGYDSFYFGELAKKAHTRPMVRYTEDGTASTNVQEELIYGIYFACTHPFILLQGMSKLNWGLRIPLVPYEARGKGENISTYISMIVPFAADFRLYGEIESIYFNAARAGEILYNAGFRYNITQELGLSFKLHYSMDRNINPTQKPSRVICIEYQNLFY